MSDPWVAIVEIDRWAEPWWLSLLVLAPLPWLLDRFRRPRQVSWPGLEGISTGFGPRVIWSLPWLFQALAIASISIALARPQSVSGINPIRTRGVTILVLLDRSPSMSEPVEPLALDQEKADGGTSRLDIAKQTWLSFVNHRPNDLLGLITFSRYPETVCPPTLDHSFLAEVTKAVLPADALEAGTSLGNAIAWGVQAVRETSAQSGVLILLTDGQDRPSADDPLSSEEAARLARAFRVTLHTVALGKAIEEGDGPDDERLDRLADLGGGQAFRATDPDALADVFATIDTLERSPIEGRVRTRYQELAPPWIVIGLLALLADRLLAVSRWRKSP